MELQLVRPGMVFLVNDPVDFSGENKQNDGSRKHHYLVIGSNTRNQLSTSQCMGITSMSNKDIEFEVPILMENDTIGYIVPYNIYSFSINEFYVTKFKGAISDTSFSTASEFLTMLLDLYQMHIGLCDDVDGCIDNYRKYCSWFYEYYSDKPEYRTIKQQIDSSRKENAARVAKAEVYNKYNKKRYKPISKKKKRYNHYDKKYDHDLTRLKGLNLEEAINELGENDIQEISATLESPDTAVTVYSDTEQIKPIRSEVNEKPTIVVKKRKKRVVDPKKKFDNAPERLKSWPSSLLKDFVETYERVGIREFADKYYTTCTFSYLKVKVSNIKKELERRKMSNQ